MMCCPGRRNLPWAGRSRRASWEASISSGSGPRHENQNQSAALQEQNSHRDMTFALQGQEPG